MVSAIHGYFDQRLECAAPKRWLKYTTPNRLATIEGLDNIFVVWFWQDWEMTNNVGSAIGLAGAAILKI